MIRTLRRFLPLLGLALLAAPSAASAQSYANTVWDQLKRGYESNQGQGFTSRNYIMGRMNDDASDTWSFALTAGMTYKFWGVCDGDCSDLDIALLDVNIGHDTIDPVADAVAARSLPFVFTTGHGRAGLPEAYRDRAIVEKPFYVDEILRALREELQRGQS